MHLYIHIFIIVLSLLCQGCLSNRERIIHKHIDSGLSFGFLWGWEIYSEKENGENGKEGMAEFLALLSFEYWCDVNIRGRHRLPYLESVIKEIYSLAKAEQGLLLHKFHSPFGREESKDTYAWEVRVKEDYHMESAMQYDELLKSFHIFLEGFDD